MRNSNTTGLREVLKGYTGLEEDLVSDEDESLPRPAGFLYPAGTECALPHPDQTLPFFTLLTSRRSRRAYTGDALTMSELSGLLFAANGVTRKKGDRFCKTFPSAGARYPLELYVFVKNVTDLARGLYHYRSDTHRLAYLGAIDDMENRLSAAFCGQPFFGGAPASFVWTCIPYRSEWRYNEKAQKYALLDAGHSCENLYLAAETMHLGVCAIGAYEQPLADALLHLDGGVSDDKAQEFVVYAACAGHVAAAK